MATFFDDICTLFADRVALVFNNEHITYQQVAQRAERLALHLLKLGVKPLDRFVIQLPNIPEFVYLYIALQKVGAIPIMALPTHRHAEITQFVRLGDAIGYAMPERLGAFE
ncbi:MAG TPA: hypothetical protein DHW02_06615, partial [Ktedonobacter sp.]|nr:hypothetical protein [Ktedonobacter sp.]